MPKCLFCMVISVWLEVPVEYLQESCQCTGGLALQWEHPLEWHFFHLVYESMQWREAG